MNTHPRQRRTIRPADVREDSAIIFTLPDDVRDRMKNQAAQRISFEKAGQKLAFSVAIQVLFGHIAKLYGQAVRTTVRGSKCTG